MTIVLFAGRGARVGAVDPDEGVLEDDRAAVRQTRAFAAPVDLDAPRGVTALADDGEVRGLEAGRRRERGVLDQHVVAATSGRVPVLVRDGAALQLDAADRHVVGLHDDARAVREPDVLDHRSRLRDGQLAVARLARHPSGRHAGRLGAREPVVARRGPRRGLGVGASAVAGRRVRAIGSRCRHEDHHDRKERQRQ
jgi:hypothetical protein